MTPPAAPVRILIAAAVSILALVGLVVRESIARADGREVILAMQAVDPRDLLTGHYVTVSLRELLAERVPCPPGTGTTMGNLRPGQRPTTWIALADAGDHASVVGQFATREQALRRSPVVLRGSAQCLPPDSPDAQAVVDLEVGVDRFHLSQAEAERIDALLQRRGPGADSPVAAIVSVGADGQARLKGLRVEGRRLELNWY